MSTVFNIRDLSYSYSDRPVLMNTSLQIKKGKLTILLGRNGSGKSTFMRLLAKIIDGYSGEIYLKEKEFAHWHNKDLSRIVSYLSQSHKPVFPFIVEDVILTGRAGYVHFIPTLKDTKVVDEVIEMIEIGELRKRIYTELSGGEQQLVLLARALAQKPEVLLLDEPTSHLDYSNQVRILSLIKRLVETGLSIICAMHDPNMAFLYGDDFLFIHKGKILRDPGNKPWESPLLASIISDYTVLSYGEKALVVPK